MRDLNFINGEFYHLYNRGTDKRKIFLMDADYERFIESLHLFNDSLFSRSHTLFQKVEALSLSENYDFERSHYVEFIAYCLLPNHYHLLVRQLKEGGISKFMQKVDMGYSQYLNKRIGRSGTLYEGPFKAIHVRKSEYFEHMPIYIHLNGLDLTDLSWREGTLDNWQEAVRFLDGYRWSSHGAYMGRSQYLPLVKDEVIKEIYSNQEEYLAHLRGWSTRHLSDYFTNIS